VPAEDVAPAAVEPAAVEPTAVEPTAPGAPPQRGRRWPTLTVVSAMAALILGYAYWTLPWRTGSGPTPASDSARAAAPTGPVLLVVPFADLGKAPEAGLYADGLTEELLTQLARFKELAVLGRETSRSVTPGNERDRARELGAGYLLEGGVRVADGGVRATARLVDAGTSTVLWSQSYDEDLRARGLFALQERIAGAVATAVAQPYGIVFRADASRRTLAARPPDDVEAYACALRFYAYRRELGPRGHAEVRGCLERTAERFPDFATAWAMLSFLYLDEDRFGLNPKAGVPAPLDRALEAARRALALDPENARALQALMSALFFRQDVREALRVGEQALALNPNDTELLAEYGTRLAQSGEWARGRALVERALARNPGHSGYYLGILALCDHMLGDHDRALAEIRRADLDGFSIYHVVAAIIYAEAGLTAQAAEAGARFMGMNPGFLANLDAELAKRNFRPEDKARLVGGLRKAGLPVPERAAASGTVPASAGPGRTAVGTSDP
jgi:TolB-like protein